MTAPGPDQEYEDILDDDSFTEYEDHGIDDDLDIPMVTADDWFISPDGQRFKTIEDYYDYMENPPWGYPEIPIDNREGPDDRS